VSSLTINFDVQGTRCGITRTAVSGTKPYWIILHKPLTCGMMRQLVKIQNLPKLGGHLKWSIYLTWPNTRTVCRYWLHARFKWQKA